ncbi:hypothetical protein PhaeoP72_02835 [Phaeobacter inhibens]|nr:hypothetical protein PhaeoP72_02835 [Phaeobacter inhibens]
MLHCNRMPTYRLVKYAANKLGNYSPSSGEFVKVLPSNSTSKTPWNDKGNLAVTSIDVVPSSQTQSLEASLSAQLVSEPSGPA